LPSSTTTLLSVSLFADVTVRVEDADAPSNRFFALELVREHAERTLLGRQRMAHDVALEEQLARLVLRPGHRGLLRLGAGGNHGSGQCDDGGGQFFHGRPSPKEDARRILHARSVMVIHHSVAAGVLEKG